MVKYYRTVLVPFVFIAAGCNAFAPFDSPSGDVAILAAARACFDLGDFQCAANKYHTLQLSPVASTRDQAYSEDAFEILAQNGVTFAVFMKAILNSNGNAGTLITKLAGVLRTNTPTNPLGAANYPTRIALFGAYQKSLSMTPGRSRGLMQFITALTLMAEILGEDATGIDAINKTGILLQSDIVLNPTTCKASQGSIISPDFTGCGVPVGANIVDGAAPITLSNATVSEMSAPPSLQMILAAANEVQAGLAEMTSSGGIGSASNSLVTSILAQAIGAPVAGSPIFRYTFLTLGIGATP